MGFGVASSAQDFDVFTPIAKYIRLGDADKLSAWFADSSGWRYNSGDLADSTAASSSSASAS